MSTSTSPGSDPAEHLDLVIKEAKRWHNWRLGPVEDSDEYSIACIGLMLAVRDYQGGIPFRCYVAAVIHWTIVDDFRRRQRQRRAPARCKALDHDPIDHRSTGITLIDACDELSGVRLRFTSAKDLARFTRVVGGESKKAIAESEKTTEHFIRRSLWRVRHQSARLCPI